jgi:hypothetical protein
MTVFNSYSVGTVSVAAGATTVIGAGTIWSGVNARPGDDIVIAGHTVIVMDVVDTTHITIDAWPYTAVSAGSAYKIVWRSPLRFVGGQAMSDVDTLIASLSNPIFTGIITGPLIAGGSLAASTLTLESTSGVGTTDAIIFKTGSQIERMRIDSNGNISIASGSISGGTLASSVLTLQSTSAVGSTDAVIIKTGSQVERLRFYNDGSIVIGGAGYTTPADAYFKTQATSSGPWTNAIELYAADANPPTLMMAKSRSATLGVHTLVQIDDLVAAITMRGSNGSSFQTVGYMDAFVDGVASATSMPGRLVFGTGLIGTLTRPERLRITTNGDVILNAINNADSPASAQLIINQTNTGGFGQIIQANFGAVSTGASLQFRKSRGSVINSFTAVISNDRIAGINFNATDGSASLIAARLISEVDGAPASGTVPGRLMFLTTVSAGSTLERMRIDSKGNVVINTAAIATGATDGFLYVPTCAGTPSGTPTSYAGMAPIVVNTTNNKLYFYSSGAWRDAGP